MDDFEINQQKSRYNGNAICKNYGWTVFEKPIYEPSEDTNKKH